MRREVVEEIISKAMDTKNPFESLCMVVYALRKLGVDTRNLTIGITGYYKVNFKGINSYIKELSK